MDTIPPTHEIVVISLSEFKWFIIILKSSIKELGIWQLIYLKHIFCSSITLFDISCVVLLICSWYFLKVSALFSRTLLLSSWNLFTLSLILSVVYDMLDAASVICWFCCSKYLSLDSLSWLVLSLYYLFWSKTRNFINPWMILRWIIFTICILLVVI
jgi:hypothetical protein